MPICPAVQGEGRELTVGERIAFYRRRRGMTQQTLAGLVGRTTSWVEKVEHGRAPINRISVVRELARALDVRFDALVPDERTDDQPRRAHTSPDLTLSYFAINPWLSAREADVRYVGAAELRRMVDDVWTAYQDARWGYVLQRLNHLLPAAYFATQRDGEHRTAARALAHLYHLAECVLVKLGNVDEAWMCAENGAREARELGEPVLITSVGRGVAHALLSRNKFAEAVAVVRDGLIATPDLRKPAGLAATGTLMLVGATASARAGERGEAMAFLRHADRLAYKLGRDSNEVWTAFGPMNVAIHRVAVAAELRDNRGAVELGTSLDVHAMPRERRVRHRLEVARVLSRAGRRDESLAALLDGEREAPEHVRRHFITGELVKDLMRATKTRPDPELVALARRLGHAA
jgi:transcriptional regulator with XRE-family HTH domain